MGFADSILKNITKLRANRAINKIGTDGYSGLENSKFYDGLKDTLSSIGAKDTMVANEKNLGMLKKITGSEHKIGDSVELGFTDKAKMFHMNEKGNYDYSKIATSYVGLSAAGRIATGGGAYKDSNGNTDIIGIPII